MEPDDLLHKENNDCIKLSEIELYSFQHNTQHFASALYRGERICAGSGNSEFTAIYEMKQKLKDVIWKSWEPLISQDLENKKVKKI